MVVTELPFTLSPSILAPSSSFTIQSIQIPDFIVEDANIHSLNGGIKKTFTSGASSYAVVFKWDFGDGTPILNTPKRTTIHEYKQPGKYIVKHQACLLDLPCCYTNNIPWCIKQIDVQAPTALGIVPLLGFGLLFGLFFRKECEDYKNKKDCNKHDCQWIEERKKCVKKITKAVPVPIQPTKEEKARLLPHKAKIKPFNKEDLYLIEELRKRGAKGEPVCTGEVCKIGQWTAIARPKGQPPIIIHDP